MKYVIYMCAGVYAALLISEAEYVAALIVAVVGALLAYVYERARQWHRSGRFS